MVHSWPVSNMSTDLTTLLAYLDRRGTLWSSSRAIGAMLGPRFNKRHIADLRGESGVKIVSSRKTDGGYKLMKFATQQEFDEYIAERRGDLKSTEKTIGAAFKEWNHRNVKVMPSGQTEMF